ncbi:hypothetical protein ACP2AV_03975 [Aliiroseovarius sp. PTFE2010]|uniref:hypothetical protein n=1 Tax=Aliiroseovarius sp. PTFE2010 TaxID=3417190 RepID=UPI003CF4EEC3
MADRKQYEFGKRLQRIERHHRKLEGGSITAMTSDGLVIARPHRKVMGFPYRGLFFSFCLLLLFKAFVYSSLGAATYASRIERLQNGTIVEQAGAYVMSADPVTVWISRHMKQSVGGLF